MEKVILTQLSIDEFRQIIREELKSIFKEFIKPENVEQQEEIMNIDTTASYLSLSKGHIYKLTSSMEIPHFKRGKRLYFKKSELIDWISEGKIKTMKEIEDEATSYIMSNPNKFL